MMVDGGGRITLGRLIWGIRGGTTTHYPHIFPPRVVAQSIPVQKIDSADRHGVVAKGSRGTNTA